MKALKRTLSICLILACIMAVPCYASTPEDEISPQVLYDTYYLSPSACRDIYYDYLNFSSDYNDVTSAIADTLALGGYYGASAAASIAGALGSIYSNHVMNNCYQGWQNGRGCTLYVYTDTQPVFLVN